MTRFMGVAVLMLLITLPINFMLDASYRKRLPANPDAGTVSAPVAAQLAAARKQAWLFTTADNIGKLGMAYYSSGKYAEAVTCYQLAISKNPRKWKWYYYLGYANMEQGEQETAIKNFMSVTAKDPTIASAYYYAGEGFQKLGLQEEAEKNFRSVVALGDISSVEKNTEIENNIPLKTFAMFQLARIYISVNHPDSAEQLLRQVLSSQLNFGPAYRLLGTVYAQKEDSVLAAKYTDRANDLPDYASPSCRLIDDIALISRSDEYMLKQIDNAIRGGNDRWALALCNQAMKYYPRNKELVSHVFFISLRSGNNEKALSYLDQHLMLFSNDARELMDAMDLLYNNGLYDEALRYFYQARKILPTNSTLVMWLCERGKKQEAIGLLSDLHKNNPLDEKILSDLVRAVSEMGNDELARQYLARLKAIAPKNANTLQVTGLLAENTGDLKFALESYEDAYKAGATDLVSVKELAKLYARNQLWQQAIQHFKMALAMYPNDPELLDRYGKLLIGCPDTSFRNIPEGLEYAERTFIHVNSSNQTKLAAGKLIAALYISLGNKKNAALYINSTIDLAKKQHQSEEYIDYFQKLIAKK